MIRTKFSAIAWMLLASICLAACSTPVKDLPEGQKVQYMKENGIYGFLNEYPECTEDEFWNLVDNNYPVTPFQDIHDRKVENQDVVVDAVVVNSKIVGKSDYELEYTLLLMYELEDKSYLAYEETIDLKDAERTYEFFSFGSETIQSLEKDDIIRICCNAEQSNAVDDSYIFAIKKTGHEDGLVDKILDDYEKSQQEEEASNGSSSSEDFWASRNTPEKKLEDYIWSRVHNEYDRTTVDRIEINEDLGTDAEGDYIALVYLTWDVKNKPDMTETMLQMYSDDLAASLAADHPEAQEVAIFWQVPYLGSNTSKWSYERRNGGMYATDKVLGF